MRRVSCSWQKRNLLTPQPTHFNHFLRMLDIVLNRFFKSKIGITFKKNLDRRADSFSFSEACKIQSLARGFRCRLLYHKQKAEHEANERRMKDEAKSIHIQCAARRYLARMCVIRIAERTYVKYVDPSTEEPYWSNPKTKVVSWAKPKIFGSFADVSHPTLLPHKGTEFVVMCVNCNQEVCEVVCHQCDDAFCRKCFNALHTKGTRKSHKPIAIKKCMECDYQLATRTCETCTAEQKRASSYCDVCFTNVHRHEDGCKTKHNWSWLVQCCVECRSHAARWRCEECMDVYCTACFSKVHKRGSRVNHKCEPLTYYTPTMNDHYEREIREKSRRARKAGDAHSAEVERKRLENKCARNVQKWYRGYRGRKVGKQVLKEGRQAIRAQWRQRKKDDVDRMSRKYMLLEPLGLSSKLKSDSMEEAVLKSIPSLFRKRAKKWILQNLQDEYWFEEIFKDPKKMARTGFGVGKLEELVEQARHGGIRLPGVHSVKQGKLEVETGSVDLSRFLQPGDRVRIKAYTYTVEKDTELTVSLIPIDRVWRFADENAVVMYRYPPLGRWKTKGRKFVFSIIESQVLQMMLRFGLRGGDMIDKLLSIMVRVSKDRLGMKFASKVRGVQDSFAGKKKRVGYFDKNRQNRLLAGDLDNLEKMAIMDPEMDDKDQQRADAYLDDNLGQWEERVDPKTLKTIWVHKDTGEITDIKPDESGEKAEKEEQERLFKESQKRIAKMRKGPRKQLGKRVK